MYVISENQTLLVVNSILWTYEAVLDILHTHLVDRISKLFVLEWMSQVNNQLTPEELELLIIHLPGL